MDSYVHVELSKDTGDEDNPHESGQIAWTDGTQVTAWRAADGKLVVQIDTPLETDDHDTARVYVNDAQINGGVPSLEPVYRGSELPDRYESGDGITMTERWGMGG